MTTIINKISEHLKNSKDILFITGAGMSAASGLPTYRGVGGLYQEDNTIDGIPIEVALSIEQFRKNPIITWKYLAEIDRLKKGKKPNEAHYMLAELERYKNVTILTQNIDGFHKMAGSKNIINIHGELNKVYCKNCNWQNEIENFDQIAPNYQCPKCKNNLSTDVILFNQRLHKKDLESLYNLYDTNFDMIFIIGTSALFSYIQEPIINNKSAITVEINLELTAISPMIKYQIKSSINETLQEIFNTSGIRKLKKNN